MPTATATAATGEEKATVKERLPYSFTVPSQDLREALKNLRGVAPKASTIPVLSHALIQRHNGATSLSVNDLDFGITYTIPSTAESLSGLMKLMMAANWKTENCQITVPFAKLESVCKAADKTSEITFRNDVSKESWNDYIDYVVNGHPVTDRYEVIPADEFPPLPQYPKPEEWHRFNAVPLMAEYYYVP